MSKEETIIQYLTILHYLSLATLCERAAAASSTEIIRQRLLAMAEDYLKRALRA